MRPGLKAQARAWQERLRALKNLPPVIALLWNSGRSLVATEVSICPSGTFRLRAMLVRVDVKQLASAAENSSSGLDAPPGPPSSDWVAVRTSSAPEPPSMVPCKPSQRSVAEALSESIAASVERPGRAGPVVR